MAGVKGRSGGKRENAGRPTKADELKLVEQMDAIGNLPDALTILWRLVQSGSDQAIKLWLAYRLGAPKQTIDQTNKGEKEILVIRDGNTYPQIRSASSATENTNGQEAIQRN